MAIMLHKGDLPDGLDLGPVVAVDTETLGLNPHRDKLCLVQLSGGNGDAHLVQIDRSTYQAPNLVRLLGSESVLKVFHFARFDLAVLFQYLGVLPAPA
jgi:ribonuclease D